MDKEFEEYMAERDALFRNPTMARALKLLQRPKGGWLDPQYGPLAVTHKARLQWINATDKMIEESTQWLKDHNYNTDTSGAPALTPESRDAERIARGMQPLRRQQ